MRSIKDFQLDKNPIFQYKPCKARPEFSHADISSIERKKGNEGELKNLLGIKKRTAVKHLRNARSARASVL